MRTKSLVGRWLVMASGALAALCLCLVVAGGLADAGAAQSAHGAMAAEGGHGDAAHNDGGHGAEDGAAGHGDGHGDAHGGEHKTEGLPQLDFKWYPTQIFWLAICFVLLYFLCAGVALPRVAEVVETRESRIAYDLDRADELKNEAQALARETEEILSNARAQARAMVSKVLEEVEEEKVERLTALETEIVRKLGDAELNIQQEKLKALADASNVAVDIAQSLAEKLLGEQPESGAVRHAVETIREERAAA